ncbi:hypothetical protein D3C81_1009020 [compost metagenome]
MNSDMSMRTIASSVSKRNSASALHSSVLPTPVGPRNRNEPLGRFGSARPARERRTALDTATTASCWPITRLCSSLSMRSSLSRSPSIILATGMPVHLDTTSAISSSVTRLRSNWFSRGSRSSTVASLRSSSGMVPYCSSAMRCRSARRRAASMSALACSSCCWICAEPCTSAFSDFQISSRSAYSRSSLAMSSSSLARRFLVASSVSFFSASRSIFSWIRRRSRRSSSSGLESISMRMRLPASSIRSMALSGSWRSVM